MTFREILKLYQDGALPEQQRIQVASEIEKHEAISDYLYEESKIPALEELAASDSTGETAEDAERFSRLLKSAIHRAFVKMGIIMGIAVLITVLAIIFVLPDVVSRFYYNPNEVAGQSEYGYETTKMSLDLSVFSELFLPGGYRNAVTADSEGYGKYRITIPQTVSATGRFSTIVGKLDRGELTLYNPDLLKLPTGNAFVLPEDVSWNYHGMGAAGTREQAFAALENLDDHDRYCAYFSLDALMDYDTFYAQFGTDAQWCAVYTGNFSHCFLGFHLGLSGSLLDWDREAYPLLCQLDSRNVLESYGSAADMQTHFTSTLRYMKDHPEVLELFGTGQIPWDDVMDYIDKNGLQIYGFTVIADQETIQAIAEMDHIAYVYTTPVQ